MWNIFMTGWCLVFFIYNTHMLIKTDDFKLLYLSGMLIQSVIGIYFLTKVLHI